MRGSVITAMLALIKTECQNAQRSVPVLVSQLSQH